jgi:hypothetical protein
MEEVEEVKEVKEVKEEPAGTKRIPPPSRMGATSHESRITNVDPILTLPSP